MMFKKEKEDAEEKALEQLQTVKEEAMMFKKEKEDAEQKADRLSNENEALQKRVEIAESEAVRGEAAALREERDSLLKDLEQFKFAKKESSMFKKAKEDAEQKAKALKLDVEQWRQKFECASLESERGERQGQELIKLREENQEQLRVMKQTSCTMQQMRQENEELKGSNAMLDERLSMAEGELGRSLDEKARLAGHTNSKQKIQYMMKVKEDHEKLKKEHKELQQKLIRMDIMPNGGAGLFEKFLSGWGAEFAAARQEPQTPGPGLASRTPRRHPSATPATTPGMTPGARTPARPRSARSGRSDGVAAMRERLGVEDYQARCELQEMALERIRIEFHHFLCLVQRATNGKSSNACSMESLLEHLRGVCPASSAQAQHEPRTPMVRRRESEGSPLNISVENDMDEHASGSLGD